MLFWRNAREGLPSTQDETANYRDSLNDLLRDKDLGQLFAHLYGELSILDGKAASLLQFNSVVIAAFAVLLTIQPLRTVILVAAVLVGALGIVLSLISCYLLLNVVWVQWSQAVDLRDRDAQSHATRLLSVRHERTISYRQAWNFARIGVFILMFMGILTVVARFER